MSTFRMTDLSEVFAVRDLDAFRQMLDASGITLSATVRDAGPADFPDFPSARLVNLDADGEEGWTDVWEALDVGVYAEDEVSLDRAKYGHLDGLELVATLVSEHLVPGTFATFTGVSNDGGRSVEGYVYVIDSTGRAESCSLSTLVTQITERLQAQASPQA